MSFINLKQGIVVKLEVCRKGVQQSENWEVAVEVPVSKICVNSKRKGLL